MNFAVNILTWVMYFIGLYFTIFWLYIFLDRYPLFREEQQKSHQRQPSRFPVVSVIIPAYNAAATIKDCLLSVISLNYPRDKLEVIVVNDGSTDNTAEVVSDVIAGRRDTNIRLISQRNCGKGVALNNAIRVCLGEFFACLDSDSFVAPEALKRMMYVYEQHGHELAIVTPAMKVFMPRNLLQKFQSIEYLTAMFFNRLLSHLDSLYVAPGPFSLYRTSIIRKLGGFDEKNLTEDQEIGYRMQKSHYSLKHCFDGYVYTTSPQTLWQLFRQRSRWWRGSLLNFFSYKSLLLNPKYGHFGVFQLPFILIGYLTVFVMVFFFSYFTILPWLDSLHNLYLTGFDIKALFSGFGLSFDILRYDLGRTFIILMLMAFGLAVFFLAHRNARESLFKNGFVYLPLYFLFYYLLLSFISVLAVIQLIFGKRNDKWLGKYT